MSKHDIYPLPTLPLDISNQRGTVVVSQLFFRPPTDAGAPKISVDRPCPAESREARSARIGPRVSSRCEANPGIVPQEQPALIIGAHGFHSVVVLMVARNNDESQLGPLARRVHDPEELLSARTRPQAEVAHLIDRCDAFGREPFEAPLGPWEVPMPIAREANAPIHLSIIE